MSKQDRNGVRTAADLERKYRFEMLEKQYQEHSEGLKKVNKELEEFIAEATAGFAEMQKDLDGKIETWYYEGVPGLNREPTKSWPEEKYENHVGDLYYDKDTGKAYRFSKEGNTFIWEFVNDKDVSAALALANAAKDTADSKRRIFVTQPTAPYDKGDLWFNDGEIYICNINKVSGIYKEGDFVIATNYPGQISVLQQNLRAINADVASIETLMFGSASGTEIAVDFADAVIALISDATIDSSKIISLVANKIISGELNTNMVNVVSEDGKLRINGSTILIRDANRTRVQIGKDANEDYNIYVLDKDGKVMFDATGIHSDAIKSPIIVNEMVAENANISAGKLDVTSLFTEMNGSQLTLDSSRIFFDDKGQNLSVVFSGVTKDIENMGKTLESHGSSIKMNTDAIEQKVWQQDIQVATKGLVTTQEMTQKFSQSEQTLEGFKQQVSSTYSKKESVVSEIKYKFAQNDSPEVAPTVGWTESYPTWEDGKYIWQQTISVNGNDIETVIATTCLTGAKGIPGQDAILLMIESSAGNLFKNSSIATTLTVTIIVGDITITDSAKMKQVFGNSAKLIWRQLNMGESEFTDIPEDDERLSDNGFILTLNAHDISTKAIFNCALDF